MINRFKSAFVSGAGFAAGILAIGLTALLAQSLSTFSPGSVVSATSINANFVLLEGRTNTLDGKIESNSGRLTTAESAITKIAPIGTILAWHKNMPGIPTLPAGWVECNGQTLVDPASPLDGQVIVNLNGTGRFLRGAFASGTLQADAFQGHHHNLDSLGRSVLQLIAVGGTNVAPDGVGGVIGNFVTATAGPVADGSNGLPRLDNETRPTNMSVVWIMRVR